MKIDRLIVDLQEPAEKVEDNVREPMEKADDSSDDEPMDRMENDFHDWQKASSGFQEEAVDVDRDPMEREFEIEEEEEIMT